jgi:hypothetical protein
MTLASKGEHLHSARPEPGSHADDVEITSKLLLEVREKGMVPIPNTVDGDLAIYFDKGRKLYHVNQYVDGKVVSHPYVMRRVIQEYLIDLRERRRAADKKGKRKKV